MKRLIMLAAGALALCCCACIGQGVEENPEEKVEKPAAPSGLKATEAGPDYLAFAWDAVEGATGYNYKCLQIDGTVVVNAETQATSVKIEGLEADSEYKFAVRTLKGDAFSPFCEYLVSRTGEASQPEDPPVEGGDDPSGDDPSGDDPSGDDPGQSAYARFLVPEAEDAHGQVLAFPGAEGGGMHARGGRGGDVYHVTNLKDNGEGSLRYGIEKAKRPCTIVFDVAGTIALEKTLKVEKGDLTIAGQTAPGDGICLKNYSLTINASNVIIRFIRCRMGDEKKTEDDAMNSYHKESGKCTDIIIDHCSISWSTDECGSFYGNKDFTLQYCILSESLRCSVHGKGTHGYGGIWGGDNASFHHNLLAHHDSRNPRFDHDYVSTVKGPIHFVNNVVYNWGNNSGYGGESKPGNEPRQINMVDNYYKYGPATQSSKRKRIVNPTTKCSNCNSTSSTNVVPGLFYIDGNYMWDCQDVTDDNWAGVDPDEKNELESLKASAYMGSHTGTIHSAENAFQAVLNYAGASLHRDSVDERVTRETLEGSYTFKGSNGSSGGLIDTQSDVGGWPELTATAEQKAAIADTDGDGMPDAFEQEFGLDPADAADGKASTLDAKGRYTNLEMYLHWLVRDIVAGENAGGEYKTLQ